MSKPEPNTDTTPQTTRQSYQAIRDSADDVALRKRVAAVIAMQPSTTLEVTESLTDASRNAVRPRVNELMRMGCVIREGKRENPSGKDAYVHHITDTGERYLAGECDPTPNPPLSELQAEVVKIARAYCAGESEQEALEDAIETHDDMKQRRNPEWEPPHTLSSGLTEAEREKIRNDPVLELSDFK